MTLTAPAEDAASNAASRWPILLCALVGLGLGLVSASAGASGLGLLLFAAIGIFFGAIVGVKIGAVQRARGAATLRDDLALISAQPVLPPISESAGRHDQLPVSSSPAPDPAPVGRSTETSEPMKSKPSSFSDATAAITLVEPTVLGLSTWLSEPAAQVAIGAITPVDRSVTQSLNEAERHERLLSHTKDRAPAKAEHERATTSLGSELANLNKQVHIPAERLAARSDSDPSRAGDLEAQVDALDVELADLRRTVETERIAHTGRVTEERGSADRALDNARREYREELAKHVHTHRQTIADYRADLDTELADDRIRHAAALEEQHHEYGRQIEADRARVRATLEAAKDRNARDLDAFRNSRRQELDRQASRHKTTIENLRGADESATSQLHEIKNENRMLGVQVSSLQKQARHTHTEHASTAQRLNDELALVKSELDAERQRNAALRADVLRRSAGANQAIDRALEERTAQLAELEASVGRQRQYADTRVREVSAAAEEQTRQGATREAGLTAMVSRLKRELEETKRAE